MGTAIMRDYKAAGTEEATDTRCSGNEDAKSKNVAILCWLFISLFYAYQCLLRIAPNVTREHIMSTYDFTAVEFGNYVSFFYYGYSIMHIPIGLMFARFKARYVISFSILVCMIGALVPLFCDLKWAAIFGRFMLGMGAASSTVGAIKVFMSLFGSEKFPQVLGRMVSVGILCAVYGNTMLSYMLSKLDRWQDAFLLLGLVGIALSAGTFFLIPDVEEHSENKESNAKGSMWDDLKEVFLNRKIIIVSLLGGCMIGPLEGFADAWASAYVSAVFGWDAMKSSTIASCIIFGMACGAPIMPLISEKLGDSHIRVSSCAGALMLLFFSALFMKSFASVTFLYFAMFAVGFLTGYQIILIAKCGIYAGNRLSSLASAVCNMIMMAFGGIFHTTIGVVSDSMYKGQVSEMGARIFDTEAMMAAITIIPIGIFVGSIGLFTFYLSSRGANR